MTIKIGINGLGRIGRMLIRAIIESKNNNIEIKHINNRSNPEVGCALLKHDSIHGKFNANISNDNNNLIINKKKYLILKKLILKILIGKNLMLIMFLNVQVNLTLKINYYHI